MLTQAFWTSLRILAFRAGPEDLPYDVSGKLSRVCWIFALLSFTSLFALILPVAPALFGALIAVVSIWLVTRGVLRLRGLQNREQQTLNALLLSNALLTLLMIPVFAQLAPVFLELFNQLKAHPELSNTPDQWPQPPAAAAVLIDFLGLWQLVVCTRIFSVATGGGTLRGIGMTLLSIAAMLLLIILLAPVLAIFVS